LSLVCFPYFANLDNVAVTIHKFGDIIIDAFVVLIFHMLQHGSSGGLWCRIHVSHDDYIGEEGAKAPKKKKEPFAPAGFKHPKP
jgi:hypothetical protein